MQNFVRIHAAESEIENLGKNEIAAPPAELYVVHFSFHYTSLAMY